MSQFKLGEKLLELSSYQPFMCPRCKCNDGFHTKVRVGFIGTILVRFYCVSCHKLALKVEIDDDQIDELNFEVVKKLVHCGSCGLKRVALKRNGDWKRSVEIRAMCLKCGKVLFHFFVADWQANNYT